MMKCPDCGWELNPGVDAPSRLECPHCHIQLRLVAGQPMRVEVRCPSCNGAVEIHFAFCPHCHVALDLQD